MADDLLSQRGVQVPGRGVRAQHGILKKRAQRLPQRGEGRRALHGLGADARQVDRKGVKGALRVHQRIERLGQLAVFDHGQPDRGNGVIMGIRHLEVEYRNTGWQHGLTSE